MSFGHDDRTTNRFIISQRAERAREGSEGQGNRPGSSVDCETERLANPGRARRHDVSSRTEFIAEAPTHTNKCEIPTNQF